MAVEETALQVMRYRILIEHLDPVTRVITDEITLFNNSSQPVAEIVVKGEVYRPGLEVRDHDGACLGFLSNETVRTILANSKEEGDKRLLDDINQHRAYLLWIALPSDRAIKPHDIRVIKLCHRDAGEHVYRRNSMVKQMLDVPEYEVAKNVLSSMEYANFVTITPPAGFLLNVEQQLSVALGPSGSSPLTASDHFHRFPSKRILDVSLPHKADRTVQFRMVYGVYPQRNEQSVIMATMLFLVLASALYLTSMVIWAYAPGTYRGVPLATSPYVLAAHSEATLIGTSDVLVSLGFIGLASGTILQRSKWWALAAIIMGLVGLVLAGV